MYKYWFTFHVPVICAKFTSHAQFDSDGSIMAYQQQEQNSCCFSSLVSHLEYSNQFSYST